jgi:hypothetical protein
VVGFSNVPLRIGILLGLMACLFALTIAVVVFLQKLIRGIPLPGYALLVTGMFFLGGVQLLMLGLLGEYIGRIYRESQRRPLYIIAEKSDSLPRGYEGGVTETEGLADVQPSAGSAGVSPLGASSAGSSTGSSAGDARDGAGDG